MQPFQLQGERISLRDFVPDDLEAIHAYASDPEVSRYSTWGPNDRAQTASFLELALKSAADPSRTVYEAAVILRASGDLIGACHIATRSQEHRRGDIGYTLRRDVWGQGIGTEVASLLIAHGFEALGLHRIEATCDPLNIGSRRVLEKAGMRLEGLRRDDFFVRGNWRDSLLFSILEDEWRKGS